jgi:hypothetical protein
MTLLKRLSVATAALLTLSACSSSSSSQDATVNQIADASSAFSRNLRDAGGAVVTVSGSIVRVNSDLNAYDIAPGTALHYMIVKNIPYIDASVGGSTGYVQGTESNLKLMGVEPERYMRDTAILTLLMALPSRATSWASGATGLVRVSDSSYRLKLPIDKMPEAKNADLTKPTEFVFTLDEKGSLVQWGLFEKPGQSITLQKFEKVDLKAPSKEQLVPVPSR